MIMHRQQVADESSRDDTMTEQQSRCVWLVEDDRDVRELIAALLRSEGFAVVELCDGMEALNHLAGAEVFSEDVQPPDLVVADIMMPNFSGLDVLMGMRESRLRPPVMLVTGVRDEEIRTEARRLGATRVLWKPFEVDMFLNAVEESLRTGPEESVIAPPESPVVTPPVGEQE